MEPTRTSRPRLTGRLLTAMSGLALVAAAAAPLLTAEPAMAASGLQHVTQTSPTDSNPSKVVVARCPSGTFAIGGGAVIGGTTRVRVNSAIPSTNEFTVLATEPAGGTSDNWFVVVHATCAPAGAVPGVEYPTAFSRFDSDASHSVTVACSPGKRVIGMGGVIDSNGPGQDRLVLTAIRPNPTLTGLTVAGTEAEGGYTGGWRVKATAVCTYPVPGQQYAEGSSGFASTSSSLARAACPRGTAVYSGGFDIGTANGQAFVSTYFLDVDLAGDPSRQGLEVSAREDATGYDSTWRTAAYAICAS